MARTNGATTATVAKKPRLSLTSMADLCDESTEPDWLVERVLVRDQPMVRNSQQLTRETQMECKLVIRAEAPPVTGYADEGLVLEFEDLEDLTSWLMTICGDAEHCPYTKIRAYAERLERGAARAAECR
ncbi:hypothetical protein [Frigoriglobus tundricola]|uniref:Uncharacterized protein n=1 Tax=Frigoriglobus tundricola TaxID=2774151 RepID=A0A6M5YMN9_9BACT|nr:hypothetical protein [Frigoriglobus tundricola]QJW94606.1 hypothetical protein FTUN_2128 [Frigoriglobus tundricola]